jgi:hypothetical protein
MSFDWWFNDGAGANINDGITKKILEETSDEVTNSLSLASSGRSWNYTSALAHNMADGTWEVRADLQVGAGAGTCKVTCKVRIYDSDGTTVRHTVINEQKTAPKSQTSEVVWTASPTDIDVEAGGYISVHLQRTAGLHNCNCQFGMSAHANYNSKLIHPDYQTVVSVNAVSEYSGGDHMVWLTPLLPVAQWNCVPHQELTADFDVGVVVSSHTLISKVVYTLVPTSGTYQGVSSYIFADVMSESWNSRTRSYEYRITVDVSAFSADTEFYIDVAVHGTNGAIATRISRGGNVGLDRLYLVNNVGGTIYSNEAWVDNTVGAGDGTVGDSGDPFPTIHKAAKAQEADMLTQTGTSRLDFCKCYLENGQDHEWDRDDIFAITTSYGWYTVLAKSGQDYTTTTIKSGGTSKVTAMKLVCVDNVTVGTTTSSLEFQSASTVQWLWIKNAKVHSADRHGTAYPIGGPSGTNVPDRMFAVDTIFDEIKQPFPFVGKLPSAGYGPNFCRGCTCTNIGNDCWLNTTLVLNSTVDDVDPGATGWHSDAFQLEGAGVWKNVLWKNNKATTLRYQGMMVDEGPPIDGFAFVNNYMSIPENETATFVHFKKRVVGFEWFNFTFHYTDTTPPNVKTGRVFWGCPNGSTMDCQFIGMDVQGGVFAALFYAGDNYPLHAGVYPDLEGHIFVIEDAGTYAKHNNFYNPEDAGAEPDSQTPGDDVTTADPDLDANGVPNDTSGLRDRITTPVTLWDLNQDPRSAIADIGAYEKMPTEVPAWGAKVIQLPVVPPVEVVAY